MGNRVSIYPTKFTTFNIDGSEGETTFGFRVADDQDNTYSNFFMLDDIVGKTPGEIVELAREIDGKAADMIAFAEECQEGLDIGEQYYTWADIKAGTPEP